MGRHFAKCLMHVLSRSVFFSDKGLQSLRCCRNCFGCQHVMTWHARPWVHWTQGNSCQPDQHGQVHVLLGLICREIDGQVFMHPGLFNP